MDLPYAFFPASVCPHEGKRAPFADYGRYLNVDLVHTDCEQKTFRPQKLHAGIKHNLCLAAQTPTLPLSDVPCAVSYPFEDRVMDHVNQNKNVASEFVRLTKIRQGRMQSKAENKQVVHFQKDVKSIAKLLSSRSKFSKIKDYPLWFKQLMTQYRRIRDLPYIPVVNPVYTGGCMATLENEYLLFGTGLTFSTLKMVSLKSDETCRAVLKQTPVFEEFLNSSVCEVRAARVNNVDFCGVRTKTGSVIYKLTSSAEDGNVSHLCLDKTELDGELPTSISLSPYIGGEGLVSSDNGSVYLVRPGISFQKIINSEKHRFHCEEPWRQCHFGAHPRQVILSDRTAVQLFDIRTHFDNGMDLFAIPNKLLHMKERVMVTDQHPVYPFHHFIATDYSLFMVDQRFPGNVVMHWTHLLTNPPQYLCVTDVRTASDSDGIGSVVLLADQQPAETCCFHVGGGSQTPVQSVSQPWKVSGISDFAKFTSVAGSADPVLVKHRFNTSLAGIAASSHQSRTSFTIFQLDSLGEVFYQVYSPSEHAADKTCSWGPGSKEEFLKGTAKRVAEKWLHGMSDNFTEFCKKRDLCESMESDNTGTFFGATRNKVTSFFCPLCMPNLMPNHHPPDLTAAGDDIDFCECCGHSLSAAQELFDHRQQDMILNVAENPPKLLNTPCIDDFVTSSPNTMILLKLWKGDQDIEDLLAFREKERDEKKEVDKGQKKGAKPNDDDDGDDSDYDSDDSDDGDENICDSHDVGMETSGINKVSACDVKTSSETRDVGHKRKKFFHLDSVDHGRSDISMDVDTLKEISFPVEKNSDPGSDGKTLGFHSIVSQQAVDNRCSSKELGGLHVPSVSRKTRSRLSSVSSVDSIQSILSQASFTGFLASPVHMKMMQSAEEKKRSQETDKTYLHPNEDLFFSLDARQSLDIFSSQGDKLSSQTPDEDNPFDSILLKRQLSVKPSPQKKKRFKIGF